MQAFCPAPHSADCLGSPPLGLRFRWRLSFQSGHGWRIVPCCTGGLLLEGAPDGMRLMSPGRDASHSSLFLALVHIDSLFGGALVCPPTPSRSMGQSPAGAGGDRIWLPTSAAAPGSPSLRRRMACVAPRHPGAATGSSHDCVRDGSVGVCVCGGQGVVRGGLRRVFA